ncbi:LysR family transcriptional regulator [Halobacillus amylolyticus]|uniref:LysR family transcriptional regulator n=1 Tax=Halobacillus amylolyticus TaxID=2932259 RepID=A0ABY4H6P8_9BACI|nr:LysR family transcriptional regulator [Halobacillus amylolyticus]UOR10447.1 LysR family transcriptional regulator [Halobacillus amylolyticus]
MDLEALKTYVTVIELESFTKAARMLNLSQPTVSFHIKNLEDFYQSTLIDRSPKRFRMTQTGELVHRRARQILSVVDKSRTEVYDYHNQLHGTLRIGASYTVGEYILPRLLKVFNDLYPEINLRIEIENTERINRSVQLHEMDIGLVEGQVKERELHSVPFLEDEMVVVIPLEHSIRKQKEVSFHQLQDLTWISRESGSGTRAVMDSILESYNIRPKKMVTIGSNHGVIQGVKQGLGLSLISKTVVEHTHANDYIYALPFIKPPTRFFSYVIPAAEQELSKNASVFIESMKKVYNL